jgi:hypothetical protein
MHDTGDAEAPSLRKHSGTDATLDTSNKPWPCLLVCGRFNAGKGRPRILYELWSESLFSSPVVLVTSVFVGSVLFGAHLRSVPILVDIKLRSTVFWFDAFRI